VPSTGGRAARPSAKKSLGFWYFTFDWRFMSLKNSIGGVGRCSPRNPSKATAQAARRKKPIRKFLIILVKHGDTLTANAL
jgi:hypothetical protein